jgi:hypothetical protein
MPKLPVFINSRDRLSSLAQLITWLEAAGHEDIVIVDNDSSYEPLLDYYDKTPHEVVRLGQNLGHLAPWVAGVIEKHVGADEPFVMSDPDVVPAETCPTDAADLLLSVLERFPEYCKVGLALLIHDLPDSFALADDVRRYELRRWQEELEPGIWIADVDTTFAVYPRPGAYAKHPALRTGAPYVARHLPWYQDSSQLDDEEKHYRWRAREDVTTWNRNRLALRLDHSIQARVRRSLRRMRTR